MRPESKKYTKLLAHNKWQSEPDGKLRKVGENSEKGFEFLHATDILTDAKPHAKVPTQRN